MTELEIKKRLYKEKPTAHFNFIRKGVAYYNVKLEGDYTINFEVPVDDMGDADFHPEMEAKLMNRWIVVNEIVE